LSPFESRSLFVIHHTFVRKEISGSDVEGSIRFTNGYLDGFDTFQRIGDACVYSDFFDAIYRGRLALWYIAGGFDADVDFNGLSWSLDPSFTLSSGATVEVVPIILHYIIQLSAFLKKMNVLLLFLWVLRMIKERFCEIIICHYL
jgi:hypothetical protein